MHHQKSMDRLINIQCLYNNHVLVWTYLKVRRARVEVRGAPRKREKDNRIGALHESHQKIHHRRAREIHGAAGSEETRGPNYIRIAYACTPRFDEQ
jgi:hypothetical protein